MNIGKNLKAYRKRQGLTQRELARRAGVTVTTISNTETDRMERIARAWGYASLNHLTEVEKAEFVQYLFHLIDQK